MAFVTGEFTSKEFQKLTDDKQREIMHELGKNQNEALQLEKTIEKTNGKIEGILDFCEMISKQGKEYCSMLSRSLDILIQDHKDLKKEQEIILKKINPKIINKKERKKSMMNKGGGE